VPSSSGIQNAQEITLEAWIFPQAQNNAWFLGKSDGLNLSSQRSYEFVWHEDGGNTGLAGGKGVEVNLFLGSQTWALLGAPLAESNWVHVAATYQSASGQFCLYTNGVLASATNNDASGLVALAGQTLRQTTLPLVFGGEQGTFASGFMDEVRIWSRALSSDEVASDFSCPLVGASSLAAYWNFDDGTADDLTGNGNNGALSGDAEIEPISGPDVIHAGCAPAATLGVSLAAGLPFLSVSGKVGTAYRIQYANQLAEANWATLVSITLPTSLFIFSDSSLGTNATRFYRAVTP
jgi:hypothetical protein